MQNVIFVHQKGGGFYKPEHKYVNNFAFLLSDYSSEEFAAAETNLADAIARVAEHTGCSINDIHHLFPAILRMLKSDSVWTK